MSEPGIHPDEQLQELIDDRLSGAERAAVEEHLAGCERCRRLHTSLLTARRLLRGAGTEDSPPGLTSAIDAAIAAEAAIDEDSAERKRTGAELPDRRPQRRRRAAWLALAAAVLVALGIVLIGRNAPRNGTDQIAELIALRGVAQPSDVEQTPAALEERLAASLPFRPRVLDLAMMELRVVGGGTATIDGAPTAWMLYEGPDGRLLCAMYRARLEDLPATADSRAEGAFVFRVYRRDDLTVVTWQEGDLVCALVGAGEPEAVVALAKGKAMLPG